MIQWLWLLDGCLQTLVLEICIVSAYVPHLIYVLKFFNYV